MSNKNTGVPFEDREFGFRYGGAEVTRLHSDAKKGSVLLGITTERHGLQVYVTKSGMVRVFDQNGEWVKPKKNGSGKKRGAT